MRTEILMNGTIKIVIIPENEIEVAIVKQIAAGGIDATIITQHTQILDKVIQDGLVISPSKGDAYKVNTEGSNH
jgi:hypothetical protein